MLLPQELLCGALCSGRMRSLCGCRSLLCGPGPLCGSMPGALCPGRLRRSVLLRVVRSGELPSASPSLPSCSLLLRKRVRLHRLRSGRLRPGHLRLWQLGSGHGRPGYRDFAVGRADGGSGRSEACSGPGGSAGSSGSGCEAR